MCVFEAEIILAARDEWLRGQKEALLRLECHKLSISFLVMEKLWKLLLNRKSCASDTLILARY
jgi:hypothetical protein